MTERCADTSLAIDADTASTSKTSTLNIFTTAWSRAIATAVERVLCERVPHKLFRFSDGYQPPSLNGTFRRLMRDTGLLKDEDGQNRTLYSLRHTYATFDLLRGGTDIHTLSKQMGNLAAMIERHYSKLTATMAADRLA